MTMEYIEPDVTTNYLGQLTTLPLSLVFLKFGLGSLLIRLILDVTLGKIDVQDWQ